MLLHTAIVTLSLLISSFTVSLNAHEPDFIPLKKSTHKNYVHSIIKGLVHGIALQCIIQEISSPTDIQILKDLRDAFGSCNVPLECLYFVEDELAHELFEEEDFAHNFSKGISTVGYTWLTLLYRHIMIGGLPDRALIIQRAIIHACDGNYDEFMSKDPFIFYKALGKTIVRSIVASTIFNINNGILAPKSFKYRYGLFEALIPLVDLIEKMPALRNWHIHNKKEFHDQLNLSCDAIYIL